MKRLFLIILLSIVGLQAAFAQFDRDVFYFRGRNSLADGKYAQAIENFNILVQLDEKDYWAYFFRGIAKYNLGDYRGAQQDFESAVTINPVFTDGFHYRAITLSRFSRYDEAFADFDRAISLRPGNIGVYYSRGVTHFLAQQFEEAVADFDKYLKKEPKDPSAYLNRGASYLFLKDTLQAVNDYNRAIKLDRFEPEGFVRRGRLYAEQKKYDLAIADMNHAISLDTTNTFAYFNRALMHYEVHDYNSAMNDLDRVLKDEPGNALTLYNRSLIYAQVGQYDKALEDIDRVININPNNVLAYFNRASYFIEMGRWQDALDDYDKTIELYPDFAKAYQNRSYVKNMLGMAKSSRQDYETAQKKVRDYQQANRDGQASFADTTKKYSALLALDGDFAQKDFDNELLQHRDIDIRLRPLYKFQLSNDTGRLSEALSHRYENALIDRFISNSAVGIKISNDDDGERIALTDEAISGTKSRSDFIKGLYALQDKQYNTALMEFDNALNDASSDMDADKYSEMYRAFYLMNRAVLRADMIEFIATIQSNVQTLSMDDKGTTRARVSDQVTHEYDYSESIEDIRQALSIIGGSPYLHFNLGNLLCLSSQLVESIENYDKAISLYPYMGDAYFNRGLVLIYLKDKEKGCIDLSRAGELGVADAYSVISKYCENEQH